MEYVFVYMQDAAKGFAVLSILRYMVWALFFLQTAKW
jgi:hypothetical protein